MGLKVNDYWSCASISADTGRAIGVIYEDRNCDLA